MLQYLPMLIGGLNLLSGISSAKNTAKGYVSPAAEQAQLESLALQRQLVGEQRQVLGSQLQALANQNRLSQAYINPDDVITRNLMADENKYLNDATQSGLSNLLAANRKARLMGRQSFFNPERQDEAISQFLTRASDENTRNARSNALNRLMSAAQGYQNTAQGYGSGASGFGSAADGYSSNAKGYSSMIERQIAAQQMNDGRKPALFGAAADALDSGGSLSNIFSMLTNKGGNAGGGAGGASSLANLASMASMFA